LHGAGEAFPVAEVMQVLDSEAVQSRIHPQSGQILVRETQLAQARMLLAARANVNARTSYGATPLWFAMWHDGPEQLALVQALIDAGADVDSGHVAPYRMPSRPSLRSAEGTVLGGAAASGKAHYVRVLLAAGASVDARQPGWRTPLMQASGSGSVETVRLLLEAGADINANDSDGKTALVHAREAGHGKTLQLLELAAAGSNGK